METKIRIWLAAAMWAVGAVLASAQIAGPWHGELSVGGHSLPIVFNFNEDGDGISVSVDSPMQGAKGLPAEATLSGDTLRVGIPVVGADFCGVVAEESIGGKFTQSGMTLDLTLVPGEYIPPRSQTPKPPYPYQTREVSIVNPVDSTVLAGTLTLPVQYNMPVFKEFPLVVFVSGSGAQNRDEEIMGHKPFAVLADRLAKSGIASLRYDDRGFGQSTDDSKTDSATTATFASDAKAAIDWARANFDKAGRVGVIGHSEGGTIAYMLAAEGSADFIVSLAGPALRGDSVLLLQNEALLRGAISDDGLNKYLKGLRLVFQFILDGTNRQDYDQQQAERTLMEGLIKIYDKDGDDESDDEDEVSDEDAEMINNLMVMAAYHTPWIDYMLAYDPAEAIGRIRVPVMAINGDLDRQVIAEPNISALRRALPADTPCKTVIYPGLNHMLQPAQTGHPAEYGQIDQTISEEVIRDIIAWINSL